MFPFWKKKDRSRLRIRDQVWISQEACDKALAKEAFLRAQGGESPLIMAFFESTFRKLSALGEVERAKVLLAPPAPAAIPLPPASAPVVLFAEHYPLPPEEERVLEAIRSAFPAVKEAVFYSSLESPLLRAFGGEKTQVLLESLGLAASECLEHPLVTTALRRAQDRLAKQVSAEIRCRSAEEWFSRNLSIELDLPA